MIWYANTLPKMYFLLFPLFKFKFKAVRQHWCTWTSILGQVNGYIDFRCKCKCVALIPFVIKLDFIIIQIQMIINCKFMVIKMPICWFHAIQFYLSVIKQLNKNILSGGGNFKIILSYKISGMGNGHQAF